MYINVEEVIVNDDYISRKYIIEKLNAHRDFFVGLNKDFKSSGRIKIHVDEIKECTRVVEDAKPIKIAQKVGYWRPIYQGDEIINYRCSNCENGNTFGKNTYGMNYCNCCGSKNTVLR